MNEVNRNWKSLNAGIDQLDEVEVKMLLDQEMLTTRRVTHITRLHERFTRLRANRERAALMKGNLI
jgi:hypothetical protein